MKKKKKKNFNVKSVIRKENIKTVLISAKNVNILHMKNVLINLIGKILILNVRYVKRMVHEIKEHIIAQTHNVIIKSIKNVKKREMIISKFTMEKTFNYNRKI